MEVLSETGSLLKKKSQNIKWNQKLLKSTLSIILIGILLLGVIYFLYKNFTSDDNIQLDSKEDIKLRNSLHISSIATTNGDYLKKYAPQVECDPHAKYRSINGSCNNLVIPTWGAAKTPFLRMFNANYSDGYYKIRVQTDGSSLPGVRVLNGQLFLNREIYHVDENNVLLMPFGQFIAHDMSGLPTDVQRTEKGEVIFCCKDGHVNDACPQCETSVEVTYDDPVPIKQGTCLPIVRLKTSRNYSYPLYPTTFINVNTHFIDASEVYGSNESDALRLRSMEGGRLNFSTADNGQMFCPFKAINTKPANSLEGVKIQYDTGDPNGNQNLGITMMQTLFLRYHNYIAFRLSSLNPFWSDEMLYQETRRIVIGTKQRIVYEDFLPIVIGKDFQELYGLNKENIYNPTVNPTMSQEMSSAAYRILHTIIPVQFNFINKNYETDFSVNVTDVLQKPDLIPIDNHFDKLLKGFLETPGRMAQPSYNFNISNFMFDDVLQKPKLTGTDLMSVDITRGRDVGLEPYNQYRNLCGLPMAKDFEDLGDSIHIKDITKLKELYHSVNDIDLMVGMLLEKRSDDALMGPTARCLIADGFYRSKAGDRFFYDVQGQPGSFTPDQLKVIKKITLGHVICATSNVDHIQHDMFKMVDHKLFPTNKLKCDEDFHLDLKDWKEYPHF